MDSVGEKGVLNGKCSGICGGAIFWNERLNLDEHGEMDVFKQK